VEKEPNGELLLTWNRDSDAIRNATRATLQITDGEQHENVDMDLSQLRNNGSIVYSPSSADVRFSMEVVGRDQSKTTSEQVRMLRSKQSPLETQAADVKPAPAVTAVPTGAAATATATKNGNPTDIKQASNSTPAPEEPSPAQPEAPRPQRRGFDTSSVAPLASRIRPAMPSDIPDAPSAGAVTASVPGVNLPVSNVVPGAPVPPMIRPNAPAPTPAAPAPTTPATTAGNAKQGGNIQQAVLITRKEPEYPKIAKQTGAKGAVVLNATIGKDGHIKAVKVISGHPMLQNAAKEAVMQWVYKPTLLNGTAVETVTQITLNFVGER
jgi:protein TonB